MKIGFATSNVRANTQIEKKLLEESGRKVSWGRIIGGGSWEEGKPRRSIREEEVGRKTGM
jgi:hypothetical protein